MQKNADTDQPIVNRVAKSPLQTIDLEEWYPEAEVVALDLADQLFQGLILREKDFRMWVKEHDWSQYEGKHLAVFCSADAIIPVWAYMLVTSKAGAFTNSILLGTEADLLIKLYEEKLHELKVEVYQDAKIVIKGCSKREVPPAVYVALTNKLLPYVTSIMYGEPCSTVPVYKRPKG